MERNLRCNVLRCSHELRDAGWVTACSHIYCDNCVARTGLTAEDRNQRVCPACNTQLPEELDVMRNLLKPPEEWMTNILSGLSPSVVMECAGRALSFWSYQVNIEIALLEAKISGQNREYESMRSQYEKKVAELEETMERTVEESANWKAAAEDRTQAHDNVLTQLNDTSRKYRQVQQLYDNIKRQAMIQDIHHTASQGMVSHHAVDAGSPLGQPPDHRDLYPQAPVANQRHSNSHTSPRYSIQNHTSLPMTLGTRGGNNEPYSNGYSGVQQLNNINKGRILPQVNATPQPNFHRPAGTTSMGLSNVQGVVVGTPRGAVKGTPRLHTDPTTTRYGDTRQLQRPSVPFPLAGLGPGLAGLGASRHAPSNSTGNFERFGGPSLSSTSGFRDSRAPGTGYQPMSTGLNLGQGVVPGSRGYERR